MSVLTLGVLDLAYQLALMVRLERLDLDAQFVAQRHQAGVDIGERRATVDLGLALAQQVQIRAMQHKHSQEIVASHPFPLAHWECRAKSQKRQGDSLTPGTCGGTAAGGPGRGRGRVGGGGTRYTAGRWLQQPSQASARG